MVTRELRCAFLHVVSSGVEMLRMYYVVITVGKMKYELSTSYARSPSRGCISCSGILQNPNQEFKLPGMLSIRTAALFCSVPFQHSYCLAY